MPRLVGPKQEDWSQDVQLSTLASLQQLKGQLLSVKSVGIIYVGTDITQGRGIWNEMKYHAFHPIQERHFNMLSERARTLFEDAVLNPNGYMDRETGRLKVALEKPPELPKFGTGDFYASYTWYVDWADEQDAWLIGEVVCPDGTGSGVSGR